MAARRSQRRIALATGSTLFPKATSALRRRSGWGRVAIQSRRTAHRKTGQPCSRPVGAVGPF
jgi:hypothetical protein